MREPPERRPTRAEPLPAHPPRPLVRREPPSPRPSPPGSFASRRPATSVRPRGRARAHGGYRRTSRAACRSNRTSPNALWTYGTSLVFDALQHDRRVVTAETERVRHGYAHVRIACFVRDVVEITCRILDLVVDGRRQLAVANRKRRKDRLKRSAGAEAVARRPLCRRHRSLAG